MGRGGIFGSKGGPLDPLLSYTFDIGLYIYTDIDIRNTQRGQYKGHNTPLGYYNDQGPCGCDQYDGQGVYCGRSTASEVLLFLLPNYIHVYAIIMQ